MRLTLYVCRAQIVKFREQQLKAGVPQPTAAEELQPLKAGAGVVHVRAMA